MGKCEYSKKFQPLLESLILENNNNWRAVVETAGQLFSFQGIEDAEAVCQNVWSDLNKSLAEPTTSEPTPVHRNAGFVKESGIADSSMSRWKITEETKKSDIQSIFGTDEIALNQMLTSFKTSLIKMCLIDFDWGDDTPDAGITQTEIATNDAYLNDKILRYKHKLLNILRGTSTEFSKDTILQELEDGLREFEARNNDDIDVRTMAAYIILSRFDDLLKEHASFIGINAADVKSANGFNKYRYVGPKVSHYTAYGEGDEHVSKQYSDITNIILSMIPEVDPATGEPKYTIDIFGNKVPTKVIGTDGFSQIAGLSKQFLFYSGDAVMSHMDDELMQKVIDEDFLEAYIRDGVSFDFAKFFEFYNDYCQKQTTAAGVKSAINMFGENYASTMFGKIAAIQKYIFGETMPLEIRQMFASTIRKTELTAYRGYKTVGEVFRGINLRAAAIESSERQVKGMVRGALTRCKKLDLITELKENFGMTINPKDASITFTDVNNPGISFTISVSKSDNGSNYTLNSNISPDAEIFAQSIIFEVLGTLIPEGYNDIVGSNKSNWQNDYLPIVWAVIASNAKNPETHANYCSDFSNEEGLKNLQSLNKQINSISQVWSIVLGSECKNVVMSPSGSKLPTQTLTCLNYKIPMLLHWMHSLESNVYKDNVLVKNPKIYAGSMTRNEILIRGISKGVEKLTQQELLLTSVFEDFYWELLNPNNTEGKVYFQNATFADKNTHFLQAYRLNEIKIGSETLRSLVTKMITSSDANVVKAAEDAIEKFLWETRNAHAKNIEETVLKSFNEALGTSYKNIEELHEALIKQAITPNSTVATNLKKVDPAYLEKDGTLNITLYEFVRTNSDENRFKARITEARNAFRTSLLENDCTVTDIRFAKNPSGLNFGTEFYNKNTGNVRLASPKSLSPIARAYFLAEILLSNEINNVQLGEVFYHPNKDKSAHVTEPVGYVFDKYKEAGVLPASSTENEFQAWVNEKKIKFVETDLTTVNQNLVQSFTDFRNGLSSDKADVINCRSGNINTPGRIVSRKIYHKYVESSRLIAQIKRTVVPGATMHPYEQGVKATSETAKNDFIKEGSDISVPLYARTAVIKDMPGVTWNLTGLRKDDNDSMDGCGISSPVMATLENYSLLDAAVKGNKKSIMPDIDPETGRPILCKWAVYKLTNEYRRNSYGAIASGENMFKKMHSETLRGENVAQKVADKINEVIDARKHEGRNLAFKDWKTDTTFEILSVRANDDTHIVRTLLNKSNGETIEETVPMVCKTLYDIDQIVGGAWCGNYSNGKFEFSEDNVTIMTALVCENKSWKDCFIGYLVNSSAIKVGAHNVNDVSVWKNKNAGLSYFHMRTDLSGIQMDADHELDLAEVTEMTQMISALIEDGHYVDLVSSIYKDIGETVFSKLKPFVESVKQGNMDDLYIILANSLIETFKTGDKDTLGLAQSFMKKAEAAIKAYNKAKNNPNASIEFKIPFSAATISGAFIANVASTINHKGIRHKYAGIASVLNPSRNMIMYYELNGRKMLFKEFVKELRGLGLSAESAASIATMSTDEFVENFIETDNVFQAVTENISFDKISLEDTIVYRNDAGKLVYERIDDVYKLNALKDAFRDSDQPIYLLKIAPRNLKQADITFNVVNNGIPHQISMYELSSVRASFDIQNGTNDRRTAMALIMAINRAEGYTDEEKSILRGNVMLYARSNSLEELFKNEEYNVSDPLNALTKKHALRLLKEDTVRVLGNLEKGVVCNCDIYYGNNDYDQNIIQDYKYHAAECIMGRFNGRQFGLDGDCHISDIIAQDGTRIIKDANGNDVNEPEFFTGRLAKKYDYNLPASLRGKISPHMTLWHNGEQYLVIVGEEEFSRQIQRKGGLEVINVDAVYSNGAYWENNRENAIVKAEEGSIKFKEISTIDDYGNPKKVKVIVASDVNAAKALNKSQYFDHIRYYNYTKNANSYRIISKIRNNVNEENPLVKIRVEENGRIVTKEVDLNAVDDELLEKSGQLELDRSKERFDARIKEQGKRMRDSFIKQLQCVGARIPSQAMQSFMPMEIVAYTDVEDNQVYVPLSQTWLQGSDFDIDKVFILMHSINSWGNLTTESDLSEDFDIDVIDALPKPNGKRYIISAVNPDIVLDEHDFDGFRDDTFLNDPDTFIKLATKILNAQVEGRTIRVKLNSQVSSQTNSFELFKKLVELVNKHAQSVRTELEEEDALKNRIVESILRTIKGAKNQVSAMMPIDMTEQQDAAKLSSLGEAEKLINSDNPAAIFLMQVQNMVGKEVIGITAVGLKGFFGLTTYYNIKINDLAKQVEAGIITSFDGLRPELQSIAGPDLNHIPLANVNFTRLIDAMKRNGFSPEEIEKVSRLHRLANVNDAALAISGLLSAATDNAKELILSKINATPELVDIYIYLLGLGKSFREIAKIMSSPAFNAVTELGKKNIYDPFTEKFDVKKALQWTVGMKTPDFIKDSAQTIARLFQCKTLEALTEIIGWPLSYKAKVGFKDITSECRRIITGLNDVLQNYPRQSADDMPDEGAEDYYTDEPNDSDNALSPITDIRKWVDNEGVSKAQLRSLMKIFKFILKRAEITSNEDNLQTLGVIAEALTGTEETSIVGQSFGINQGCKTNIYGLWNYKYRVESFIEKRYSSLSRTTKLSINRDAIKNHAETLLASDKSLTVDQLLELFEKDSKFKEKYIEEHHLVWKTVNKYLKELDNVPVNFNFLRFLDNEMYQQSWIGKYELMKVSHNILDAFVTVPHFKAMMQMYGLTYTAIDALSSKFRFVAKAAQMFKDSYEAVSEMDFKALENYFNERIILDFLMLSGKEFNVPAGAEIYYSKYTVPTSLPVETKLSFNSIINIASYKKLFEDQVIKYLRKEFPNNAFLEALIYNEKERNDMIVSSWKLPLDMMNIDKLPETKAIYETYLKAFDEIAGKKCEILGGDWTVGEAFYIYNMIVNKDSFGEDSLTRIFENLIQSPNCPASINDFMAYVSEIDATDSKVNALQEINDIAQYLARNSRKTKFEKTTSSRPNTGDFTFDMESRYDGLEHKNPRMDVMIAHNDKLSSRASFKALVEKAEEKMGVKNIVLITDEEAMEFANESGNPNYLATSFVKDGMIYLNKDKASSGEVVHEIAHVILATLKTKALENNSDITVKGLHENANYYTMLNTVSQLIETDESYKEIAEMYARLGYSGSDLLEEVLCKKIEEVLNLVESKSGNSIETVDLAQINEILGILFDLQVNELTQYKNIADLIYNRCKENLSSHILNTKTMIQRSQMDTAYKKYLISEGKLDMEC